MKKMISSLCAIAFCAALALAVCPTPAKAADTPVESSNIYQNTYDNWSSPIASYLYLDNGAPVRVEHLNSKVVVESYGEDFQLRSKRTIADELPLWGGFYAGETFNFLIYGQANDAENDKAEVIRVVKYDKSWHRMGQASLNGANTTVPFDAGSLRCAEYGGMLYVRTCHQMYTTSDGLRHQANLTFSVRESDPVITDSYSEIMNTSYGYVSHSFNQFLLVDRENRLVAADHGDAYPRSAVLMRYAAKAGGDTFTGSASDTDLCTFPGEIGENQTSACLGGLAETAGSYLAAYSQDTTNTRQPQSVYLAVVSKDTLALTSTQKLSAAGAGAPVIAPAETGGYVLWNRTEKNGSGSNALLSYVSYDENGNLSPVSRKIAPLSDCQPIPYHGGILWYVTNDSVPTFYTLSSGGLQHHTAGQSAAAFRDVPESYWAHDAISFAVENGLFTGKTATAFAPGGTMTRGMLTAVLYRYAGSPQSFSQKDYADVGWGQYYADAVSWARENKILKSSLLNARTFRPGAAVSRGEFCVMLKNFAAYEDSLTTPETRGNPFKDLQGSSYGGAGSEVGTAILNWAYPLGILTGSTDTTMNPGGSITRAQAAAMLMRFDESVFR